MTAPKEWKSREEVWSKILIGWRNKGWILPGNIAPTRKVIGSMRAALLLAVDEAESAEKAAKCTLFTNHHVKTKMAKLELETGSQALDVCLRVVFGMPKFGEGTDGLGVNVKTPSGDKEQLQETANALAVPTPAAVPSLYPQMPPPYGVNTGVIPLSPQKRETKRAPTELPPSAYTMAPVRVVEGGVLHGVMQLT
ncbi:unnamed protein product [Pleuronectes platessa]|uniref:Uncharacterized protein n=1 Tax=Pleuronectes platessa TaxID=8262 RepID=A0A9N7W1L2_PLEPL|nr:unnamed protein product [Pleuronectes platessa]